MQFQPLDPRARTGFLPELNRLPGLWPLCDEICPKCANASVPQSYSCIAHSDGGLPNCGEDERVALTGKMLSEE